MTTISSYTTQGGVRYRVRYRKPDGSQTDKRGFKRKRDAEQWAAEHVATASASCWTPRLSFSGKYRIVGIWPIRGRCRPFVGVSVKQTSE